MAELISGGEGLVLVAELAGRARLETLRLYSQPTEVGKQNALRRPARRPLNANGAPPPPAKPWRRGGVSERGSGRSETVALCAPLCDRRWR